jgi:hypothetical protein
MSAEVEIDPDTATEMLSSVEDWSGIRRLRRATGLPIKGFAGMDPPEISMATAWFDRRGVEPRIRELLYACPKMPARMAAIDHHRMAVVDKPAEEEDGLLRRSRPEEMRAESSLQCYQRLFAHCTGVMPRPSRTAVALVPFALQYFAIGIAALQDT